MCASAATWRMPASTSSELTVMFDFAAACSSGARPSRARAARGNIELSRAACCVGLFVAIMMR